MKKVLKVWKTGVIGMCVLLGLNACRKEKFDMSTTSDVNITEYLLENPEQFSQFSQILEITGNDGFLGAYGGYTCFVPDNGAIDLYLKEHGKGSVSALSVPELKEFVQIHVIRDTLSRNDFKEGRLRTPTMYGQYIITGTTNAAGKVDITVNRQAVIKGGEIRLGNGIIHVIDHALEPEKRTLAKMLESNTEYSIFSQALKTTGLYAMLDVLPKDNPDTTRLWNTVMAESDAVLKDAGINSYQDLFDKYCNTGDPARATDSLHLYVAYHIIPGRKYLSDIYNASSHSTLSPEDVVTTKLQGRAILFNDDTFNGVHEPGAEINREASDNTAANGVLHFMNKHYAVKLRLPFAVYWEVTDQPEITKLSNFRRQNSSGPAMAPGDLKDVQWGPGGSVRYYVAPEARKFYVYHDDYLQFASLRTNSASSVTNWIEFKTPLLVKGRYKVWISIIRRGGGQGVQVSFDNQVLRTLRLNETLPAAKKDEVNKVYTYPDGMTPESLEMMGRKMAFSLYKHVTDPGYMIDYYPDSFALLAGTITVEKTDRHTLRFQAVGEDKSGDVQFDMVHFIPENEDQLWPKFNPDGSVVQRPK